MTDELKITRDVAIPLGRTEKGHLRIARIQGTEEGPVKTMVGELHPLEEGVPIMGEVLSLTPSETAPFMHVETVLADPRQEAREARGDSSRCVSIPSQKFQDNWERVFGKKPQIHDVN